MKQTRMILVGGFLGAGKTTLLSRTAAILMERGNSVGLITNDQAADLVDTALLRQAKMRVYEIAGGCFCCRFGQLIETAEQLIDEISPDIIIGEPVGSCTDLSATVMQPIKAMYADSLRLAPLSVLAAPRRLWEVIEPWRQTRMHASALYILRKQLEESDLIVINKRDLLDPSAQKDLIAATCGRFPGKPVHLISALTGDGVETWLDAVISEKSVGAHIADVDYDVYAEGEAVLGWLNASATVTATTDVDWQALARLILDGVKDAVVARQAEIAHVKLSLTAETGQYVGNLVSTSDPSTIHGQIGGSPVAVTLVLNARVEMPPEELQSIVEGVFHSCAGNRFNLQMVAIQSFRPGRPMPTHRYTSVA